MRTMLWLIPPLVAAREEPIHFFNGKLRPVAAVAEEAPQAVLKQGERSLAL